MLKECCVAHFENVEDWPSKRHELLNSKDQIAFIEKALEDK